MSLRKLLAFSFIDRYASLIIGIGASMLLARLLTPEDIGLFSVTMVLLSFTSTFRDFGAGTYIVQEKNLTTDCIRATLTVQFGLGFLIAVLVALASTPVASFYSEPRMRDIMLIVALNYAVNPFGSLTQAWLSREMRFDTLALVHFLSTMMGACVSVILAWSGQGPMSLVLGSLATTLASVGVGAFFRPPSLPWRPGLRELRRVISFGTQTTSVGIINAITQGAPELLLGKLQSFVAVGLFSRANGLVAMFNRLVIDAITSISLSLFSKEFREHGNIISAFLKATAYTTAIGWTFCVMLFFLAHPVIRLLYGNQWDSTVELTRLISVGVALAIPAALGSPALIASGAIFNVVRATFLISIPNLLFIYISSQYGLLPVGWAIVACGAVQTSVYMVILHKTIHFSWRSMQQVLLKSAWVGISSGIAPAAVFVQYGPTPVESLWPVVLGLTGGFFGFFVAVKWLQHPIHEECIRLGLKIRQQFQYF